MKFFHQRHQHPARNLKVKITDLEILFKVFALTFYESSLLLYLRMDLVYSCYDIKYSQTSMARTPLGLWKFVRDRGSSS